MDNNRRREVYLRDRSQPTPAQARRLRKAQVREDNQVVVRASRLRKAIERADAQRLRVEGRGMVRAIRSGLFSPQANRHFEAQQTLAALNAAVEQPPVTEEVDA